MELESPVVPVVPVALESLAVPVVQVELESPVALVVPENQEGQVMQRRPLSRAVVAPIR